MYYSKFDDRRICLIVHSKSAHLKLACYFIQILNSCDYFWLFCVVLGCSSIDHIINCWGSQDYWQTIIMNISIHILYRSGAPIFEIPTDTYYTGEEILAIFLTQNQIPNEYAMWNQLILIDLRHSLVTLTLSSIPMMLQRRVWQMVV